MGNLAFRLQYISVCDNQAKFQNWFLDSSGLGTGGGGYLCLRSY